MKKLILVICFLNSNAWADSIAFVNAADLGNTTGTSLTVSYTVGSGSNRLLIVSVAGDTLASDLITGITYNGVAMTLAIKQAASGGTDRFLYLFYLANPASGAHDVVISASGSTFIMGLAADYTGAKQTGQPDATISGNSNTAVTLTTTTVADNSWTTMLCYGFDGTAMVAGAGTTRRTFGVAFGVPAYFDSNAAITPAGSTSLVCDNTGGVLTTAVMASFAPATGAAAASNGSMLIFH